MGWEPTLTPFGNIQAVTLHPWLISNRNQILPPRASPLMVYDGVWYTFICPATWRRIQSLNHAGIPCMLWLKLLNHTMGFFARSNSFTWSESYCAKNQSRTLKPFFLLSTTPPFILITTFWGGQYPFKCTKREIFPCFSLQESGRLSWERIASCIHHTLHFTQRFRPKNRSGLRRLGNYTNIP